MIGEDLEYQDRSEAQTMKLFTEDGDFGERLILQGKWRPSFAEFMKEHGVKELSVNSANGYTGCSVHFLEDVQFLEGLHLLVYNVEDLDVVQKLKKIKSFRNNCYDKTVLDFSCLPKLEKLFTGWHEGVRSLFDHRPLNPFVSIYTETFHYGRIFS